MIRAKIVFKNVDEAEDVGAYLKNAIPSCDPKQPIFNSEYPKGEFLAPGAENENKVVYLEIRFSSNTDFKEAQEIVAGLKPGGKLKLTLYDED